MPIYSVRHANLAALQAEMRQIFPQTQRKDLRFRDIRAENQARFDASLRMRNRPTRVS